MSGGSTSTRLDPAIANTYVHQASAYIEREVAPDFGVRTGVVLNARRQPYGTINVSRPLDAYSVPASRSRIRGLMAAPVPPTTERTLTAYNLTAESSSTPPVNLTTNLPDSNSEYYTWEITATKRQSGRWSLLASFTDDMEPRGGARDRQRLHAQRADQLRRAARIGSRRGRPN